MTLFPALWKAKDAPQPTTDVAALGEAVQRLVEDRLALYRAAIKLRASHYRAQAIAEDSATNRLVCISKAEEAEAIVESVLLPANSGA